MTPHFLSRLASILLIAAVQQCVLKKSEVQELRKGDMMLLGQKVGYEVALSIRHVVGHNSAQAIIPRTGMKESPGKGTSKLGELVL